MSTRTAGSAARVMCGGSRSEIPPFIADILNEAECARGAAFYYRRMFCALKTALEEVIGDSPNGYKLRDAIAQKKMEVAMRMAIIDDGDEKVIRDECKRNAAEYIARVRESLGLGEFEDLTIGHLSAASVADGMPDNKKEQNENN